jgi:hypothetical protein
MKTVKREKIDKAWMKPMRYMVKKDYHQAIGRLLKDRHDLNGILISSKEEKYMHTVHRYYWQIPGEDRISKFHILYSNFTDSCVVKFGHDDSLASFPYELPILKELYKQLIGK